MLAPDSWEHGHDVRQLSKYKLYVFTKGNPDKLNNGLKIERIYDNDDKTMELAALNEQMWQIYGVHKSRLPFDHY